MTQKHNKSNARPANKPTQKKIEVVSDSASNVNVAAVESGHSASTPDTSKDLKVAENLTRSDRKRKSTLVVYTLGGQRGSIRVSKTLFENGEAPVTLPTPADWPFAAPKPDKQTMTPEERKAARKARPALTDEQRLAKLKAKVAALEAKQTQPELAGATL